MKKRLICTLLASSLLITGLSGCGKKGEDGRVQLEVGNWAQSSDAKGMKECHEYAVEFEKKYPNIKVIEGNSYGYDVETFNVKASAGQLPAFLDTFFTETQQIIKNGYATDITEALKENGLYDVLNPEVLKLASDENGNVYGIPKEVYAQGLVINKKLFAEAGLINSDGSPKVPQTYTELAEYAKIIKDKTGMAGIVLPTTQNAGGWIFMNIAWSYGVEFEENQGDGKWKAVFDTPQFKNALQYVKDLRWKYDVLPDNKNINIEEQRKLFGVGQAAMTIASPDIVNDLVIKYGMNKDDIYFARVPEGDSGRYSQMGGGITMFMSGITPEQADAGVKWLMMIKGRTAEISEDVEKRICDSYQKTIDEGGVIFPKSFFGIWNSEERNKKDEEIRSKYANVDIKDYEDYASFEDVTIRPEESACCQQLYSVLDNAIQAVIVDENSNIDTLTKTAVNDFQKNHLDKMN